ncbi:MAG TPA: low molecular weight protein arginine phosphatase, partial [Chloroflexi bacterium]|nr:low molecular weight protein arginine phosphatase [Chloroflexota bacterium]
MATVLFVCTGNLCRSPMAAALLQARLVQDPARRGWRVLSAGVWAEDGLPASPGAVMAMAERGLDLGDHRSCQVTEPLMREADLILGMTAHHVEALRLAFPQAADRVRLLAEMAGESHGVADPYGLSPVEYRATAAEL